MQYLLTVLCIIICHVSYCQEKDTISIIHTQNFTADNISSKTLSKLQRQYISLDKAIQRRTEQLLEQLQKKEAKLREKIAEKDSVKADQLFGSAHKKYRELQTRLQSPVDSTNTSPLKEYIPNMDSTKNALNFLLQKNISLPATNIQQIKATSAQFQQLQGRLEQVNEVQAFVKAREQQLKDQLGQG